MWSEKDHSFWEPFPWQISCSVLPFEAPQPVSAQLHRALAPLLVVTTLQISAEEAAATKEMKLKTEFAKGPCLNFQKIILKEEVNTFKQIFL